VRWKLIALGPLCLSLTGCAPFLTKRAPQLVPPSLTVPCPEFLDPEIKTNGGLAKAYVSALDWGSDCRARHRALADAVKGKP